MLSPLIPITIAVLQFRERLTKGSCHICQTMVSTLTKKSQWYTIAYQYHSISFSTIGPFKDISAGLSRTLNGNLKYHSIPLNGTNIQNIVQDIIFKKHSETIQIPLAIIPQHHSSTI